jgi:predicted dithiol-disulfide oxidoreductase (DUF899 family)
MMTTSTVPHPPIVSRESGSTSGRNFVREKELAASRSHKRRTTAADGEDRKDYVFDGSKGKQSPKALFEGRRQLVVYHFMFDHRTGLQAAQVM